MQMLARLRYKAQLHATLIHADGTREDLGDMWLRKSWLRRLWDRIHFDERGLITDAGLTYLATAFTVDGTNTDMFAMQYHDSGNGAANGTATAAAQTDTTLQSQTGPTTRATGTNTKTQSASGTGSTTPAIMTSVGTINYVTTPAGGVVEWGLFNQSAQGGTMWDHRIFAAINVVSGDAIQFTYTLSLPGGGT